ncbi:MAG: creatininase family protein [Planctomycetales bacterium]|nr:creatininase family protein [Planctomycetales bacterium]
MADPHSAPRPFMLLEANYRQLLDYRPNVALLPWGATEAHNYHLPHGTDVIEAASVAAAAAQIALQRGAKPIVLPTIPFGNDEQQLDQVATISFRTSTALAVLEDVVRSLAKQQIDRVLIVNGHGGNEFKPMVRDLAAKYDALIVVANFWQLRPDALELFDEPGDHGGELETSLLLHLCPDLVKMNQAGSGASVPFDVPGLKQPGVWTPRPWSHAQPDTGCGDPARATAEKGERYLQAISSALAEAVVGLSAAKKGQSPYL